MAGFRVVRRPNPALTDPMTQAEQSGHIRRLGKANGKPIYKIISPDGESLRGEIYRAGGHVTGGNPQKGAFAKPKILDPLRPSQPPSRPPLPAWKPPDTLGRLNDEWKSEPIPEPFGATGYRSHSLAAEVPKPRPKMSVPFSSYKPPTRMDEDEMRFYMNAQGDYGDTDAAQAALYRRRERGERGSQSAYDRQAEATDLEAEEAGNSYIPEAIIADPFNRIFNVSTDNPHGLSRQDLAQFDREKAMMLQGSVKHGRAARSNADIARGFEQQATTNDQKRSAEDMAQQNRIQQQLRAQIEATNPTQRPAPTLLSLLSNPDTDRDEQDDATEPLAEDVDSDAHWSAQPKGDTTSYDPRTATQRQDRLHPPRQLPAPSPLDALDEPSDDDPLADLQAEPEPEPGLPQPTTPPLNRTGPAISQRPNDLSNLFLQMLTQQSAQLAKGPDQVPMQQFQKQDFADANRLAWYQKNVRMDPGIQARIMNSFGPGAARLQDMIAGGAQQRANAEHGRGVDALSAILKGIPTAHNMAQESAHTSQQGRGPQSMEQLLAAAVQSGNQEEVDRILGLEQQRAAGKRAPAAAPSAERQLRDKIARGEGAPEDIERLQQVQGKDTGKADREQREQNRKIMDLEDTLDEMDPDDPAYQATKDFVEGLRRGMTEAEATARADKKEAARGKAHGGQQKAARKGRQRLYGLQTGDPNDPANPGWNNAASAADLKDQLDKAEAAGILDELAEDLDAELEAGLDARPSDAKGNPKGTKPRIKNQDELRQQLRNKIVTDWQNAHPEAMQEGDTAGFFGGTFGSGAIQSWLDRHLGGEGLFSGLRRPWNRGGK